MNHQTSDPNQDPVSPLVGQLPLKSERRTSVSNSTSPPPPECPQAPETIRKSRTLPSTGPILISPIGLFGLELLEPVTRMVRKVFGLDTRVTSLLEDIQFAWNPERGQYHSTPILEALAARLPPEAVRVAALCRVDLFIPILTHVFGEAQLNGRACIVSSCRLSGGLKGIGANEQFITRIAKEIIHELGHTFNLRHCPDPECPMHYCRSESDVDQKSDRLCRYCRVLLRDALIKI